MYNEGEKKKWCLFLEFRKKKARMVAQLYFSINKRKGKRGKKEGVGLGFRRCGGCNMPKKERRKFCIKHQHQKYCKAKEELWKLKYFITQKYNLQKIL